MAMLVIRRSKNKLKILPALINLATSKFESRFLNYKKNNLFMEFFCLTFLYILPFILRLGNIDLENKTHMLCNKNKFGFSFCSENTST